MQTNRKGIFVTQSNKLFKSLLNVNMFNTSIFILIQIYGKILTESSPARTINPISQFSTLELLRDPANKHAH